MLFGFMLSCNCQCHLYSQSTLLSEMYDDFLVVRNYGKLSAKFLLGTSTVIEKVGLLSYFWISCLNNHYNLPLCVLQFSHSEPTSLSILSKFFGFSVRQNAVSAGSKNMKMAMP